MMYVCLKQVTISSNWEMVKLLFKAHVTEDHMSKLLLVESSLNVVSTQQKIQTMFDVSL